jgi:hypothetical protein
VDAGPLGHINIAAGFGSWPAGEAMVRRLAADRYSPGSQEARSENIQLQNVSNRCN